MQNKEIERIKNKFINFDDYTTYRVTKRKTGNKRFSVVHAEWVDTNKDFCEDKNKDGNHQWFVFLTSEDGARGEDENISMEKILERFKSHRFLEINRSCLEMLSFCTREEAIEFVKNRAWVGNKYRGEKTWLEKTYGLSLFGLEYIGKSI